jgi:hypothetical protein
MSLRDATIKAALKVQVHQKADEGRKRRHPGNVHVD